jgi:hypothetical protein
MNDSVSDPKDGLDQWLADQYHKLITDLAANVDIDAGLREALIRTHHTDLVADLDRSLDVDAGLAAIVPVTPTVAPPNEPPTPHPNPADAALVTATSSAQGHAEPADLDALLQELIRAATSWDPRTRLTLRAHPLFILTDLRNSERILDHLGRISRDAVHLVRVPDRTLRHLGLALGLTLDLALAFDRASARDRASGLTRDLDRVLDLASDLARDLALALDLARDLASDFALALNHDLDLASALASALDFDLARNLARNLARTSQTIVHLHNVLSDMTGVDLQRIDLTGIPLEGLRWSDGTQWPPEWDEQIRRDSVQITDGVFEVGRGGHTYAPAGC